MTWTVVSILNFAAALVMLLSGADALRHRNRPGGVMMLALGASVAALSLKYWVAP